MNEFSIYVHIPFCNSKCYYCDFCSFVENEKNIKKYFIALKNEIIQKKVKGKVKSIYFGGGTPSSVDEKYVINILNLIFKNFTVDKDAEITIEVNPNSLNKDKLQSYFNAGFNRLSMGVQTTNCKSLKYIGRITNEKILKNYKKNIKKLLKIAKKIGFKNISTDIILGLPYNNEKFLIKDLKFLTKYCNHISTYMLMIEEGTKLFSYNLDVENIDEMSSKQYEIVCQFLKNKNFERYEVSNFAKNQTFSKHNLNYWNRGDYLGFGLSAHSFLNPIRFYNTNNFEHYLKDFSKIEFVTCKKDTQQVLGELKKFDISIEKLNKKEAVEEKLMLSLRCASGLNLCEFNNNFYDILKRKEKEIKFLIKSDLIKIEDGFLRLTDKGFLVANQIILKLL